MENLKRNKSTAAFKNLSGEIVVDEERPDGIVEGFRKNAGTAGGMPGLLGKPYAAASRR